MKNFKKFSDKLSDSITDYTGSWSFIFWFLFISAVYIAYNIFANHPFDPWAFPGLNLLLGFQAALTAPFMLMSGNRQQIKDRKQSEEDLKVDKETNKIIKQIEKDIAEIKSTIKKRQE